MARRKGQPAQHNSDKVTSVRGIHSYTLGWIDNLRHFTGSTSGEVVNDAVEALVWFFAHAQTTLSWKQQAWARHQMLPLLKRLPRFIPPERFTDGAGI